MKDAVWLERLVSLNRPGQAERVAHRSQDTHSGDGDHDGRRRAALSVVYLVTASDQVLDRF